MNDLLQAAKAVIYDWDKYQNVQHESVNMLSAAVERAENPSWPWQPVATAPTDTPLLATYLDDAGNPKIIRAELIGQFTQEAGPEWDCAVYLDETDCWYRPAGWVELMDHWDDHDSCYIHADIIGWMPLPKPMEEPA